MSVCAHLSLGARASSDERAEVHAWLRRGALHWLTTYRAEMEAFCVFGSEHAYHATRGAYPYPPLVAYRIDTLRQIRALASAAQREAEAYGSSGYWWRGGE